MSDLGGVRLASLACHVPPSGAWWASCMVPQGSAPPALGETTLTIGSDLRLVGAVARVGEEAPSNFRAIVRGGAGWWLPLAQAASWQADAGVKLSTILKALAAAARTARAVAGLGGEEALVPPTPDARPLTAFGWPAAGPLTPSTGAMAMAVLVARGALPTWRVEPGGATRFDAWPTLPAADGKGRVMARRLDVGVREVGLDTRAAAFLPGATIEGVTIRRSMFVETAGELRVDLWES